MSEALVIEGLGELKLEDLTGAKLREHSQYALSTTPAW